MQNYIQFQSTSSKLMEISFQLQIFHFFNIKKQIQIMNFQLAISKTSRTTQNIALQRISSLITRFHAALLPKANDAGVYRDLSEEQQYLLTNLDNENPLHSILAGCLAIDSCLSSISQSEQNLTNKILKNVTSLSSTLHNIENQIIDSVQKNSLTIMEIEELWKQVDETTKNLLSHCHELPYSQENEEFKKQLKIISQEDITFKSGEIKQAEKCQDDELNTLKRENESLKQELLNAQKKAAHLELKINNMTENNQQFFKDATKQRPQTHRKYSENELGEREGGYDKNAWPLFASPSSTNTGQQKQLQSLRQQISLYEKNIAKMHQQFNREKKRLKREIRKLQQELDMAYESQDPQLIRLLQQLQDEVQALKEERRHDERIINQIQSKLQGMSINKQSRIRSRIRNQSRVNGLKYSNMFNNKNYYQEDFSDVERKSPEFKTNYETRGRFYTTNNNEISKSATSMPKGAQDYPYRERRQPYLNIKKNEGLKYARIMPGQERNYSPINYGKPSKPQQNKGFQRRDFYAIPMVESKLDQQSFKTPNQKQVNFMENKKINNPLNRKLILPQQTIKIKNEYTFDDQNPMKLGKGRGYNDDLQREMNQILENRYRSPKN